MEKQLTIKEVIELTSKELNSLNIPVSMINSIGAVIAKAVYNLDACIEAMNAVERQQQKELEANEKPENESEEETEPIDIGELKTEE